MTPVFQTIHGPQGNCYEACLASILDMPLERVPRFQGDWWGAALNAWLATIGKRILFVRMQECEPLETAALVAVNPSIAAVKTITGPLHSVVCAGGKMIHDPSPRPLSHPSFPVILWSFVECLN